MFEYQKLKTEIIVFLEIRGLFSKMNRGLFWPMDRYKGLILLQGFIGRSGNARSKETKPVDNFSNYVTSQSQADLFATDLEYV